MRSTPLSGSSSAVSNIFGIEGLDVVKWESFVGQLSGEIFQ